MEDGEYGNHEDAWGQGDWMMSLENSMQNPEEKKAEGREKESKWDREKMEKVRFKPTRVYNKFAPLSADGECPTEELDIADIVVKGQVKQESKKKKKLLGQWGPTGPTEPWAR